MDHSCPYSPSQNFLTNTTKQHGSGFDSRCYCMENILPNPTTAPDLKATQSRTPVNLPHPYPKTFSLFIISWPLGSILLLVTEKTTIPSYASRKHERHLIPYTFSAKGHTYNHSSSLREPEKVNCLSGVIISSVKQITKTHRPCSLSKPTFTLHSKGNMNQAQFSRNQKNIKTLMAMKEQRYTGPNRLCIFISLLILHHMMKLLLDEENENQFCTDMNCKI